MARSARSYALFSTLAFGYAFLYLPIASVIVYSFNESRMVTVWAGFSLKWYGELLHNERLLSAAGLSIQVAAASATVSTILGGLAGWALARRGRFVGRSLFAVLISAPLVTPEAITGLSMLLMFVGLEQLTGWPDGRGVDTLFIAHVVFSMGFVAVVAQARAAGLDRSLEEAAMDLGARPWRVALSITLPLMAPALASGWLLAFSLSLDDLVISSFVAGPGSTTLPMLVFSSVRMGVSPQINALATIIVVIAASAAALAGWWMLRADRRRMALSQRAAGE